MSNLGFTPAQTAAGTSDTGALAVQGVTNGINLATSTPLTNGVSTLALGTANASVIIVNSAYGTARVAISGLTVGGGTLTFTAQDSFSSNAYIIGGFSSAANTRTTTATVDGSYTFNVAGRARLIVTVTTAATAAANANIYWSLGQPVGLVTVDTSPTSPAFVQDNTVVSAIANRIVLTQTQVTVPAATSTLVLAANVNRRSLRISGSTSSDSFRLAYGPGQTAATSTSSALFGSGGVFTAEQYGPGDGVPTGAIYAYSSIAFIAQVGEGN